MNILITQKQSSSYNILTDHILVYLLIATSGIPYFVGSYILMPLSFLYAVYIAYSRGIKFVDKSLIGILLFILAIVNLKELVHGYLPSIYENLVVILKYAFPFVVVKTLAINFMERYIKTMYFIALSSIIFFLLFNLIPGLESFFLNSVTPFFKMSSKAGFYEYAPSFIFYTISTSGRNAGPFWEPGGYVVFLVIALIFMMIQKERIFSKQGIILLSALITTFSTAGYVSLFFISLAYSFTIREKIYTYMLIPVTLIIAFTAYQELEFLQSKVSSHLSTLQGNYEGRVANRFTSVLIDLDKIVHNPLLGSPKGSSSEYTIYSHRNNGLSSVAVSYGLIYFVLYFWFVHKGIRNMQRLNNSRSPASASLALFAVFAFFFGQVLTDKPMVNALAMIPFVLNNTFLQRLYKSSSFKAEV